VFGSTHGVSDGLSHVAPAPLRAGEHGLDDFGSVLGGEERLGLANAQLVPGEGVLGGSGQFQQRQPGPDVAFRLADLLGQAADRVGMLGHEPEVARRLGEDPQGGSLEILDQHHLDPFGVGHLAHETRNGVEAGAGGGGVAAVSRHDEVAVGLAVEGSDKERLDDADPGDAPGEFGHVAGGASQVVVGGLEPIKGDQGHGGGGHGMVPLLHPWRSRSERHVVAQETGASVVTRKPSPVAATVTPVSSSAHSRTERPPSATARARAAARARLVVAGRQWAPSKTR
jgi:hypothetical protein